MSAALLVIGLVFGYHVSRRVAAARDRSEMEERMTCKCCHTGCDCGCVLSCPRHSMPCPDCDGFGAVAIDHHAVICPTCHGERRVIKTAAPPGAAPAAVDVQGGFPRRR